MATTAMTCIWFDGGIEEAAERYVSLVPGSEIVEVQRYPEEVEFPGEPQSGDALTVELTIAGTHYLLLNGGTQFPLTEAVSIVLEVDDQAEVDRLWSAIVDDGGEESVCGWCKDRWGLSWQITPRRLNELLRGPDAPAVMQAMLQMRKIDVAALEAAASGSV